MSSGFYTPVGWVEDVTPLLPGLNDMDTGIEDAHERIDRVVFDVKSYGAVGSGAVDDLVGIQDAIDACEAAGGGVVFFPAGTYLISDTLTIGSDNVQLRGVGNSEWFSVSPSVRGGSVIVGIDDAFTLGTFMLKVSRGTGATAGIGGFSCEGLYFYSGNGTVRPGGIYAEITRGLIRGCNFVGHGAHAIELTSPSGMASTGTYNNIIDACHFGYLGSDASLGAAVGIGKSTDNVIRGCKFYGWTTHCIEGGDDGAHLQVIGCHFDSFTGVNTGAEAVYTTGGQGWGFYGCDFSRCKGAIKFATNVSLSAFTINGCTFSCPEFDDDIWDAIYISSPGGALKGGSIVGCTSVGNGVAPTNRWRYFINIADSNSQGVVIGPVADAPVRGGSATTFGTAWLNDAGTDTRIVALEGASGAVSPELDYAEITSPVSITATAEAGANTVVTGASVAYDGSTVVLLEFFAPQSTQHTTAQELWLVLFEDGSPVGILAHHQFPYSKLPVHAMRRFTPSAGSHTYSVRAYKAGSGGVVSVDAGAGGSGTLVPAFMRIARA